MRKQTGISLASLIFVLGLLFFPQCLIAAEKGPENPLNFVVAFGAGGGLDRNARLLAKHLQEETGVNAAVVNRPGAGSLVGNTYFMGLPDDGNNVLFGSQIFFSTSILLQEASYSFDDISLISFIQIDRDCLSVPKNSPYQSFDDLLEAIKGNPGQIRISTTSGSTVQIMLENLTEQMELDFKSVYFDSASERQAALLGGHIDVGGGGMQTAIRNDERVLLVMGDERHALLPDVPTLNEILTKPVPFAGTYQYVAVHKSLQEKHPERYQWLLDTIKNVLHGENYQKALTETGTTPFFVWMGPEESNRLNYEIHKTVDAYKEVLKGR